MKSPATKTRPGWVWFIFTSHWQCRFLYVDAVPIVFRFIAARPCRMGKPCGATTFDYLQSIVQSPLP